MYNNVASEILAQLGGREFIAMTGAKNLRTDDGDNLIMTLPRNQSGANRLEIKLDYGTDTYDVRFFKYTPKKLKVNHKELTAEWIEEKTKEIKKFTGIYCDQLREIFTQVTGFDTHMPRVIGINC